VSRSDLGFFGKVHHTIATAIARAATISRNNQNNAFSSPIRPMDYSMRLAFAAVVLAACTSAPEKKEVAHAPEPLTCPPVVEPVCPQPPPLPPQPPPQPPAPEPEYRGRLQPAAWSELPDWRKEPLSPALGAFLLGCATLENQALWKKVCAAARALAPGASEADIAAFFESQLTPFQVLNADESTTGMVTGYYEPLLHGSRTQSKRFRYPIYGVPQDLLTIDLSSVYPDLKNRRLRGRVEGNKVVPYLARGDIDKGSGAPLKGLEIAWVDDAVDVFFLHIQGSGQVQLEDGQRIRVGYADQNGHPFRSLGGLLIRKGELKPERASMQGIKEWARRNPRRVQAFMNANPSYVFFRELAPDLPGPIGSLGVPLTGERSLAIDPRVIPLGAPVYLATTWPSSSDPLNRLMVAQDTGGAIAGGVRADFFWGFGDTAGAIAGRMRQQGRMWALMPNGYVPAPPPAARP
jgi:membrane-bound lytic murein transglycosylase A